MSQVNPNVSKVLAAIRENFTAVGYTVSEEADSYAIHLPHLVSVPDFSQDEQREQVQLLTEIAVKAAKVPGVTFTLHDTDGRECGMKNWYQFYVVIHVPRG